MSRKTSLTAEVHERIAKLVGSGVPIKRAAQSCGIGARTVMEWLERGRGGEKEPYITFARDVDAARATYQSALVMRVGQASRKDWRAAAWMLERQFSSEFGSSTKHEHSGPDGGPVQHAHDYEATMRKLFGQEGK